MRTGAIPRFRPALAPVLGLASLCFAAAISANLLTTMNGGAATGTSARPATKVNVLSCEKLADIPGKAITTAIVTFPPNGYSPAHRHPGSVTAYVLKGHIRSQLQGGPAITYAPGQTWFEPKGALHLFAENTSKSEPAELLALFVTDQNCGPLVIPEPDD